MRIGFLGLGKMGKRMVWKLLMAGSDAVVWNRSIDAIEELVEAYESLSPSKKRKMGDLSVAAEIADFKTLLRKTRVFWVMLPAGEATNSVLSQLGDIVSDNDIVIDGGNSYYKDTEKWFDRFAKNNVRFLGIGTSGGIKAVENGFPLMVGGSKSAYEHVKPILQTLASPHGAYQYFGTGGVGHFIKMVHNGIEYGMMQSLGEGFGVLEKGPYPLNLHEVSKLWEQGTIISGFLLERATEALRKDPTLSDIVGEIGATGEAAWTIEAAKKEKVPHLVIEESLRFRTKSHTDKTVQKSFAAKLVAALRHQFGGHKVKEK